MAGTRNANTGSTNEPADMSRALARFLRSYPAFAKTGVLDVVRATDYARLDQQGHTYLDYTGAGLYAESQLRQHQELLTDAVFGNPHSQNQPSRAMSQRVEATRAQILEFFHAAPEEYEVIFTPNATGALRLVGESYPFGPDGHYLLTFDNHNSVNGIREFARAKGRQTLVTCALTSPELRVPGDALAQHFSHSGKPAPPSGAPTGERRGEEEVATTCSPIQPSPTSPAYSTPWSGSHRPRRLVGTCCLTRRHLFRPTGWTSLAGTRTTWRCRSTRSSAIRRGSGRSSLRRPALAKLRRPWYAGGTLTFSSVHAAGRDRRRLLPHPGRGGVRGRDARTTWAFPP